MTCTPRRSMPRPSPAQLRSLSSPHSLCLTTTSVAPSMSTGVSVSSCTCINGHSLQQVQCAESNLVPMLIEKQSHRAVPWS